MDNQRAGRIGEGPYDDSSRVMFDFVTAQVPRDAVVTFFKPRAMRLITGRQALATSDGDRLCATDYAIIRKQHGVVPQAPLSDQWLPQVPCSLEPLFDNTSFRIFAIRR
jgi:hypothetical protein